MGTTNKKKKAGLGKGLSAIIGNENNQELQGYIPALSIEKIEANPKQPRTEINPEELIGLADSIREHGILEPLIVTEVSKDQGESSYQLVAGERRMRAAKLAQLQTVPAIVKEVSDQELLELAIIENIQRKDLNALEEANALSELHKNYGLKLESIAKKIGRDISTVSNKMRLLKLPQVVQEAILRDEITESHAYALLALKNKDAIAAAYNMVVKQKLSVRQTEELVRKLDLATASHNKKKKKSNAIIYDEETAKMTEELKQRLGKGFRLIKKKKGGKITIPFANDEQLEKIYAFLTSKRYPDKG
jgi:ParB family chromosome partitioning protein